MAAPVELPSGHNVRRAHRYLEDSRGASTVGTRPPSCEKLRSLALRAYPQEARRSRCCHFADLAPPRATLQEHNRLRGSQLFLRLVRVLSQRETRDDVMAET